jgi:hypothetical protein
VFRIDSAPPMKMAVSSPNEGEPIEGPLPLEWRLPGFKLVAARRSAPTLNFLLTEDRTL